MDGMGGQIKALFTLEIVFLSGMYILSAANEIWSINWIKEVFHVDLPIFSAMLLNSYWPLQGFLYYFERQKLSEPRIITTEMYKGYFILGSLAGAVSLTRCYGIVDLPPTLYVITANTEIVWESFMTQFILGRRINIYQFTAVCMVISGVAIALYDPSNNTYGASSGATRSQVTTGVCLSLLSRFLSALNTILAERLLGKDRKSAIGVSECTFSNSIIPFFLLPLVFIFVPEYKQWGELTGHDAGMTTLLVFLCCGVGLSKLVDRMCKFSLVNKASTMYFAGVDAAMKMVAGFGAIFFFNQSSSYTQLIGFVLIVLSFIPMRIGSHKEKEKERLEKEQKRMSLGSRKSVTSRASLLSRKGRASMSASAHRESFIADVAAVFGELDNDSDDSSDEDDIEISKPQPEPRFKVREYFANREKQQSHDSQHAAMEVFEVRADSSMTVTSPFATDFVSR